MTGLQIAANQREWVVSKLTEVKDELGAEGLQEIADATGFRKTTLMRIISDPSYHPGKRILSAVAEWFGEDPPAPSSNNTRPETAHVPTQHMHTKPHTPKSSADNTPMKGTVLDLCLSIQKTLDSECEKIDRYIKDNDLSEFAIGGLRQVQKILKDKRDRIFPH